MALQNLCFLTFFLFLLLAFSLKECEYFATSATQSCLIVILLKIQCFALHSSLVVSFQPPPPPFSFHTAVALECQTCTDIQCSSTVLRSCSTERWCMTASIKCKHCSPHQRHCVCVCVRVGVCNNALLLDFPANASGTLDELEFKGCAPDALCTARGFDTFSANFGGSTTFSSIYCCKGNNCNTANVICE